MNVDPVDLRSNILHLLLLMYCAHGFSKCATIILQSHTLMLNTIDKHVGSSVKSPKSTKNKIQVKMEAADFITITVKPR